MTLKSDIIEVFNDTDKAQLSGLCNITFFTFLKANYSEECIRETLPDLYSHYKDILESKE